VWRLNHIRKLTYQPFAVHRRAESTATPTASSESGIEDFLLAHPDFDLVTLVQVCAATIAALHAPIDESSLRDCSLSGELTQATSPLTHPRHFQEAMTEMQSLNAGG
jgi:hypothetical protein